MLDVEFEFFDPNPDVDFQGLKTLLRQLFDADAQQIELGALADLALHQKLIGSTIKTDGIESDPGLSSPFLTSRGTGRRLSFKI